MNVLFILYEKGSWWSKVWIEEILFSVEPEAEKRRADASFASHFSCQIFSAECI